MKIYTKTGDQGYTSNLKGERLFKGGLWMELQGSVDEINAGIGHIRSLNQRITKLEEIDVFLEWIQYCLFRIGSDISAQFDQVYITLEMIEKLEKAIDAYTEITGPMKSFLHFSGNEVATYTHVVRSVTRRGERAFVRALEEKGEFPTDYQFINRLADYFFQLARYFNVMNGDQEEPMVVRD